MYIEMRGANGEARECHSLHNVTHMASLRVPGSPLLPRRLKSQLSILLLTFQTNAAQLFLISWRMDNRCQDLYRRRLVQKKPKQDCNEKPMLSCASFDSQPLRQAVKHMFQLLT